jgi:hypothetical protein
VKITTLPPAKRVYGAEAEAAEKKETTMAEMKNMKVEVVRYNPEVDIAPHSASMKCPMMSKPRCWTRWAISKTTSRRTSATAGPAAWRFAVPAA